jgi:2-alkyl-3-oxoalkanoate reductase
VRRSGFAPPANSVRIAVTGASGFVGGRTARALVALGHDVWSYGRRAASALAAPLPRYAAWDIARGSADLTHVDAVVHCAAHVAQWGTREAFDDVNVRGTSHLLQSVSAGTPLVYVSTASVYEGDAYRAEHRMPPYAASKLRGEALVRASGHPVVVLRPHVVYGPGDTTLWPRVQSRVRGGRLFVPGSGQGAISVTHVDNLVHAIDRALQALTGASGALPHETFDIADAVVPTVDELLRTITARYGVSVELRYLPTPLANVAGAVCESLWSMLGLAGEPPLTRYVVRQLAQPSVLDIAPAGALLGYTPRWSYRDGPL